MKPGWELGVFALSYLHPSQRTSQAYPNKKPVATEKYQRVILAHTTHRANPFDSAYTHFYAREYGEAISAFKDLQDRYSDHPALWVGLTKSQFQFHQWDDALKSSELGLILNPRSLELLCLKGQVLQKQNRVVKAQSLWRQCTAIDSTYAKAHWLIGDHFLRRNSLDSALMHFSKALNGPVHVTSRTQKSIVVLDSLQNKPYFSGGIAQYFIRQLDALGSENPINTVEIQRIMDRIKHFVDLDSTNAPLLSHLGVGHMMLGQFNLAADAFERGVSINPNYIQLRQYLSIARTNLGARKFKADSFDMAIYNFKYALDYDPENQSAKNNLSSTYLEVGERLVEKNDLENGYGAIAASIYYNRENPAVIWPWVDLSSS